jgi:enoyl-CoA hydratase/carnithine racemase
MTSWTCFDVTMDGALAHVRLNHPERHNAMTPAFWDVGTMNRMPKQIPEAVMRELAYTGDRLGAERAERLGFVNGLFDDHAATVPVRWRWRTRSPPARRWRWPSPSPT